MVIHKMNRSCPLCGCHRANLSFPYRIKFENLVFDYKKCAACKTVFVDPDPDPETLSRMYCRDQYHDVHYDVCRTDRYDTSVKLLSLYAPTGSTVLDYGCGSGFFLKALNSAGFHSFGVEYDSSIADKAALNSGSIVINVDNFFMSPCEIGSEFDVIHLGDVIEHVPHPGDFLRQIIPRLKDGGYLFVEGPLEANPSLVYWASKLFGMLKHLLRPNFIGNGTPWHLFRTNWAQQLEFFHIVEPKLTLLHWQVLETGSPYVNNGRVKNLISNLAIKLSGKKVGPFVLGNYFVAIFKYNDNGA